MAASKPGSRSRRLTPIVVGLTVVLTGAAAGALFGERSVPEDRQQLVLRASHIVTTLLEWLPEQADPADIVYDGISGMLDVLDPHSNYLDPRTYQHARAAVLDRLLEAPDPFPLHELRQDPLPRWAFHLERWLIGFLTALVGFVALVYIIKK